MIRLGVTSNLSTGRQVSAIIIWAFWSKYSLQGPDPYSRPKPFTVFSSGWSSGSKAEPRSGDTSCGANSKGVLAANDSCIICS